MLVNSRTIDLHKCGVLTQDEAINGLLRGTSNVNAAETVQLLSPTLLQELKNELDKFPVAEKEWNSWFFVHAGTYLDGFDFDAENHQLRREYRCGVEAFRGYFQSESTSAD